MNRTQQLYMSSAVARMTDNELENKLRKACKKIAPLWPLERFTAVNPYLGLTHQNFQEAAIDLAKTAGIKSTLPLSFYVTKYEKGEISKKDIKAAIQKLDLMEQLEGVEHFLENLNTNSTLEISDKGLLTLADTASSVKQEDWSRFMTDRISAFAAAHYDASQAVWESTPLGNSLFLAWKEEAMIDRNTDVMGLKHFRKQLKDYPDNAIEASRMALNILQIPKKGFNHYLFKLLTQHAGWAAHAARIDWESQLNGQTANELIDFLAICLTWEASLLQCLNDSHLEERWHENCSMFGKAEQDSSLPKGLMYALIMQEAFDKAAQRKLITQFSEPKPAQQKIQAEVQAIFCIDVRSEIFRRKLEDTCPDIETMGFAGFFGFPINFQKIGATNSRPQCPVLLKPAFEIKESVQNSERDTEIKQNLLIMKDLKSAWKGFKSSAISCFSFVSPLGLFYLPKLLSDSFGFTKPSGEFKKAHHANAKLEESNVTLAYQADEISSSGIAIAEQIGIAEGALKAMSLTDGFAKMILIVGHGANMVNNPHAASYDCGACGGHAGDANAKVAAAVLNNPAVRQGLKEKNIHIPEETHFVACLHDTTTDQITVFNESSIPLHLTERLKTLKAAFYQAGLATRTERFERFTEVGLTDINRAIESRSKDWSQLRPEWGLAGCSSFIIAPRDKSKGVNLGGKSFLHTYDSKQDPDFNVLESIMTAPMVVTSWINLQYYGSTVDNKQFGSGNKTLHNITSGIGVIEGNSGDLRVGLPEQAVHDGEKFQHEPLRLSIVIDAPIEAINKVLRKNINIKQLCDNEWIFLFSMNEKGQINQQYAGDLNWNNTL